MEWRLTERGLIAQQTIKIMIGPPRHRIQRLANTVRRYQPQAKPITMPAPMLPQSMACNMSCETKISTEISRIYFLSGNSLASSVIGRTNVGPQPWVP